MMIWTFLTFQFYKYCKFDHSDTQYFSESWHIWANWSPTILSGPQLFISLLGITGYIQPNMMVLFKMVVGTPVFFVGDDLGSVMDTEFPVD